jgi:benzoyl-CoA reductase/2-hydroxyglutaryl-CoA dehydratase subunit BcrC/BadD/HgdB
VQKIGFTTSIPVEVIFAAGFVPVDLNNVFITSPKSGELIDKAEKDGFPRNTCGWIKGIYSAILQTIDINTIVGVVEGDCSNTKALLEVLEQKNIKCIPFAYPYSKDYNELKLQIDRLIEHLTTDMESVLNVKHNLDEIRLLIKRIDELSYIENKATGFENHIWQVSSSDFNGNYTIFKEEISKAITEIEKRKPMQSSPRLAYVGVPPIIGDMYDYIESIGARIVFNEIQRQFTMIHGVAQNDIVQIYLDYTYPYDLMTRIADIKRQIKMRQIDGVIHYVQSFCFRGIEDIIIRKELGVPVLTFEADRPSNLDARSKLRIEAFVDMLR